MRTSSIAALGLLAAAVPAAVPARSLAQQPGALPLPVVTIEGPTVILFGTHPDSVTDPDALMDVYAALDQQQTTMADTRDALNALGMVDVTELGRSFRIRDGTGERVFRASPDSSVVGYVLAAPGREPRVLYRVQFTDALLDAVRAYLGIEGNGR